MIIFTRDHKRPVIINAKRWPPVTPRHEEERRVMRMVGGVLIALAIAGIIAGLWAANS